MSVYKDPLARRNARSAKNPPHLAVARHAGVQDFKTDVCSLDAVGSSFSFGSPALILAPSEVP